MHLSTIAHSHRNCGHYGQYVRIDYRAWLSHLERTQRDDYSFRIRLQR